MINDLEYHSNLGNFSFSIKETFGFEDANFAIKNHLFESNVPNNELSWNLFSFLAEPLADARSIQVWVFTEDDETPAGLYFFTDTSKLQPNTGLVSFYTVPQYRNKGLSKHASQILNDRIFSRLDKSNLFIHTDGLSMSKQFKNHTILDFSKFKYFLSQRETDLIKNKANSIKNKLSYRPK